MNGDPVRLVRLPEGDDGGKDRAVTLDPAQWVHRYGDVLFGYAFARVSRRDVAEDLVQETLLAGLNARERFKGDSSEQTWLVGILRKKIADYFWKRARDNVFVFDESDDLGLPSFPAPAGFLPRVHATIDSRVTPFPDADASHAVLGRPDDARSAGPVRTSPECGACP